MKQNIGYGKKAHPIRPHILSFLLLAVMMILTLATSFDLKEDPSFLIPDDKLDETMLAAVRGDGEAAYLLALHFGLGKLDDANEIFWYTIGAENGHPDSQYGLAGRYYANREKEIGTELRKVFWLQKVAIIDYEEAISWLERWGYTLETAQPPDDGLFPPSPTLSEEDIARWFLPRASVLRTTTQPARKHRMQTRPTC